MGAWRQYQDQRPSWEQVEQWLSSGNYTGIGVILGAASGNAEAIEIEGPIEKAITRLNEVVTKAHEYDAVGMTDLLARVARGCVEQSAGGGMHFFIRVTDGPALGNQKLALQGQGSGRKVVSETRGAGGFMIVAPTPGRKGHDEGTSYLFINGGSPENTVEVTAEERDMLHTLFTFALNEDDETEVIVPEPRPAAPALQDGLSAFDDYRARVSWREILEPAGWTWSHRDSERDYWVRPGKSVHDGHSASTIEDGPLVNFSSSVDWPIEKGLSKGQVYAHLHHGGDQSEAARQLSKDGYGTVSAPLYNELTPWEAELDPDASEDEKAEAEASWVAENLPRVDWHEIWGKEHKEEWIVEPLLAARRLVALYSAPKLGKSLILLEIAAAVANGKALWGYPAPARPYRTLYVDLENDPRSDVRERLEAFGYGPDDLDNLVMLSFPTIAHLDTETGSLQLLAAIHHYDVDIVVIDTVSRVIGGEENANDTWLNFYRHTGLKMKQAGVAMIRLDHAGKDETKGQRGGSAKSGDVDAVWRLSRDGEDTFRLSCEAQRFPIPETEIVLRRVEDGEGLRHQIVGNPAKDRHERILAALIDNNIPKDLTITAATKALRAAGFTIGRGRIPESTWDQYVNQPSVWVMGGLDE